MNEAQHPRALIAGIGNIFLGDDGFGCEAARALGTMAMPPDVKVMDYGIRGLDLAYALLDPYKYVILIDAISRGAAPGTIYVLQPASAGDAPALSPDPHSMDPLHLMAMARSMGGIKAEIFIVGCEPQDFGDELDGRMGLSPAVANSIPAATRTVLDLIAHSEGREAPDAESAINLEPAADGTPTIGSITAIS